jgi:hypothetical protein
MNYSEAIAYLTRCAGDNGVHWSGGVSYPLEDCPTCHGTNDAGWLGTPGSRYGRTSAHVAPFVYRVARAEGDTSEAMLDHIMSMAVNDSETPQRWLEQYAEALSGADIDAMVDGYLDAQLWAQSDNERDDSGSTTLGENYDRADIADEYVESVRDEIAALVADHPLAVRMYAAQRQFNAGSVWAHFGHDFYLTREGHGVGFWDRGLGELGDYLTQISKWAGPASDLWDNGSGVLSA